MGKYIPSMTSVAKFSAVRTPRSPPPILEKASLVKRAALKNRYGLEGLHKGNFYGGKTNFQTQI